MPRKSRTRGSATVTKRSRNSYMRTPRSVTMQPMGTFSRILKPAIGLLRLGDHRLLAGDLGQVADGVVHHLLVGHRLADTHVQRDLLRRGTCITDL
jgi:hypothetical protein